MNHSAVLERFMAGELERSDGPASVVEAARKAIDAWVATDRSVSVDPGGGVRPWLSFESKTWELGERLRQVISKRKTWRSDAAVLDLVAHVLAEPELGRGRQPFVELGTKWDPDKTLPVIPKLLADPDVAGQAIAALRRSRVAGFSREVEAASEAAGRGWIRKEARKYLALGI